MPETKTITNQQMMRETLLGMTDSYLNYMGAYLQSLPQWIDDAQRDFGIDIYEKMSRDPVIQSCLLALTVPILSQGPRFVAPVTAPPSFEDDPEGQAKFDKAEEIRLFIEQMCGRLQQPLEEILEEMLDALSYGYSVAEKVYELDSNNKLALKSLKVKPRKNFAFVTDEYVNLVGLVGIQRGSTSLPLLTSVAPEQVISRDKFVIFTHSPRNCDPRGRSVLRCAYNSWYLKQHTWPNHMKYLDVFASPSVVGTCPPEAVDAELIDDAGNVILDSYGEPTILTPEEAMLRKLLALKNASAIALPNGATLDTIEATGSGEAFTAAIDLHDRQMAMGILIAIRSTMEAQHGSKADSSTAQDILTSYSQMIQRGLEVAFYRDLIYPTVLINFGQEAADELCPYLSLSNVAREDVVEMGNMIANLARSNYLHASQYDGLDAKLDLPKRDMQAMMEEQEELKDQAQMMKGMSVDMDAESTLPVKKKKASTSAASADDEE